VTRLLAIARTGLAAVLAHPLRSGASLVCLFAILTPYVAGIGVARGLRDQAEASIAGGADLYVSGLRFGRPAPVPLEAMETIRAIAGVRDVTPRIVGAITLGRDDVPAVVVGVPAGRVPAEARCVEGRLFTADGGDELVVGAELARRLGLRIGSLIPPFYRNERGEHVSSVVGIFRADQPVWSGSLVFCSFDTAARIFACEDVATSLLVECAPGYRQAVKVAVLRLPSLDGDTLVPAVTSRDDLGARLPRSLNHLEGILHLHFLLAFAVGIPLLMVTSGVGLSERRREAALLKATGWMTDELLLRGMVESLVLSLLGAALAVLAAWAWLAWGNGAGIAGVFLQGAGATPAFAVPFRLAPVPLLLAFVVSFAIVATGTLYSTWRAATAAPALVLR